MALIYLPTMMLALGRTSGDENTRSPVPYCHNFRCRVSWGSMASVVSRGMTGITLVPLGAKAYLKSSYIELEDSMFANKSTIS